MLTTLLLMLHTATGPDRIALEANDWTIINDGVMGGRSRASVVAAEDGLRFSGELSLANNGGFSSTRLAVPAGQLAGITGFRLHLQGDERQYQFRLRQQGFDGVAWRHSFTASGHWQFIELDLADFEPVYRGRSVPSAGPAGAADLRQIGFLIADKREGPFRLLIGSIEVLR